MPQPGASVFIPQHSHTANPALHIPSEKSCLSILSLEFLWPYPRQQIFSEIKDFLSACFSRNRQLTCTVKIIQRRAGQLFRPPSSLQVTAYGKILRLGRPISADILPYHIQKLQRFRLSPAPHHSRRATRRRFPDPRHPSEILRPVNAHHLVIAIHQAPIRIQKLLQQPGPIALNP